MKTTLTVSLLFVAAAFMSCAKSTETVIVKNDPEFFTGTARTIEERSAPSTGSGFIQLNLGESDIIETQDPLFAENNSELRLIHLLYDGLTRLDDNGKPQSGLADRWSVSPDSLQYTFYLGNDIHYHNSSKFSSGIGRHVSSADVKLSFERMAEIAVPDYAASLFDDIRGFEKYAKELETVKIPAKRIINEIEGIKVPNDSTVVFNLNNKDAAFLEKLAHPWASIYPKESLTADGGPIMQAIGTGPFYFAKKEIDRYILAANTDYFRPVSVPNRLDIIPEADEQKLLDDLTGEKAAVIVEPGPEILAEIRDGGNNLKSAYAGELELKATNADGDYRLYYNPKSGEVAAAEFLIENIPELLSSEGFSGRLTGNTEFISSGEEGSRRVVAAHTSNPFEKYLIDEIAGHFTENDFTFSMSASFAVSNEVAFSTRSDAELISALSWETPVYLLSRKGFSGVKLSAAPWNIEISNVILPQKPSL